MKNEYESEAWTGRPGKWPDAVTTGAAGCLLVSLIIWGTLSQSAPNEFRANVVTEFFGVMVELSVLALGFDALLAYRRQARARPQIARLKYRITKTYEHGTYLLCQTLRLAETDGLLQGVTSTQWRMHAPVGPAPHSLADAAATLDALFDRFRIAMELAPELHDITERLATAMSIASNAEGVPDRSVDGRTQADANAIDTRLRDRQDQQRKVRAYQLLDAAMEWLAIGQQKVIKDRDCDLQGHSMNWTVLAHLELSELLANLKPAPTADSEQQDPPASPED